MAASRTRPATAMTMTQRGVGGCCGGACDAASAMRSDKTLMLRLLLTRYMDAHAHRGRRRMDTPTQADGDRAAAVMAALQALRRTFTGFHRRLAAATGNISHADAFVLHHIAHDGAVTAGEVADFTGLTTGAVTSVLDRLEQAGFVQRVRSPDDRRVVLVELRSGVHAAMAGIMDDLHADVAAMFGGWDLQSIETLAQLLDRLHLAAPPPRHAAGHS